MVSDEAAVKKKKTPSGALLLMIFDNDERARLNSVLTAISQEIIDL